MEKRTITLTHPIEFGQDTITELVMRDGVVGDLEGTEFIPGRVSYDSLIKVGARMCGQPAAVIKKMHGDDAAKVLGPALDFSLRCLGTGPEA